MNFEIGSYVEWKHITGYIRFISDQYITICVNVDADAYLDCCVICHPTFWDEVIVHSNVPPVYPVMNPARSLK
jgi:hypothetical protein